MNVAEKVKNITPTPKKTLSMMLAFDWFEDPHRSRLIPTWACRAPFTPLGSAAGIYFRRNKSRRTRTYPIYRIYTSCARSKLNEAAMINISFTSFISFCFRLIFLTISRNPDVPSFTLGGVAEPQPATSDSAPRHSQTAQLAVCLRFQSRLVPHMHTGP